MPKLGFIDNVLLHQINRIVNENASLKQQVLEQQKIIKDIHLHNISKDVARYIDDWMNDPYCNNKTEQQDIKDFAFEITKFIDQKLCN